MRAGPWARYPKRFQKIMENKQILLLAGKGLSTNIVFNALNTRFTVSKVIIEDKEPMLLFLKRRIKRLGLFIVAGQVIFQLFLVPVLRLTSKKRLSVILEEYQLDVSDIPTEMLLNVISVNIKEVADAVALLQPDVVVVNGTRIISKKLLSQIKCPVINTHAGITPTYRGVHGAYWALVNKDDARCGVTVHLVDAGIDTGSILYQKQIVPSNVDNFVTYPLLQLATGVPLLITAVEDALKEKLNPYDKNDESYLWYHPTFFSYLKNLFTKGIK